MAKAPTTPPVAPETPETVTGPVTVKNKNGKTFKVSAKYYQEHQGDLEIVS